jgi:hypothetical protein
MLFFDGSTPTFARKHSRRWVLRRGWILFNAQKASYLKKLNTQILALNEHGWIPR